MLSVENAALTLTLAEQHDAVALKREALLYISRNMGGVMQTDGWNHLQLSAPRLVNQVVQILLTGNPPPDEQSSHCAKRQRRDV